MNKLQEKMIGDRLTALLDIIGAFTTEIKGDWLDTETDTWSFSFKKEAQND